MKANLHPNTQAMLEKLTPEQCEKILNTEYTASDIKSQMERLEEIKEQLCKPEEVTIEGWVCRDGCEDIKDSILHLFLKGEPFPDYIPERVGMKSIQMWKGANGLHLPSEMFPEVTWQSGPKRVKFTITPME